MSGQRNAFGPDPEAMGIFRGFDIKYPEYVVVLPQSGQTFSVRGLTVAEVARLKTSSTTPAKSTELINKTLWESIVDKPKSYNTYADFMKGITLKDREALIYGCYVTTFGDDREFNVTCASCGAERALKTKMSDMFQINGYEGSASMVKTYQIERASEEYDPDPVMENQVQKHRGRKSKAAAEAESTDANGEDAAPVEENVSEEKEVKKAASVSDILVAEIPVRLPVSGVIAFIHQPKLKDEHDILNEISFARKKEVELVNETLIIKRFEIMEPNSNQVRMVIREREDILQGYQSLPNIDRNKISEQYIKAFANYGIELKTKWDCFECEAENSLELDIVRQFFRMVATS